MKSLSQSRIQIACKSICASKLVGQYCRIVCHAAELNAWIADARDNYFFHFGLKCRKGSIPSFPNLTELHQLSVLIDKGSGFDCIKVKCKGDLRVAHLLHLFIDLSGPQG